MAIVRFGRQLPKRPIGICVKMTIVAVLGLCFFVFWSMLSTSSSTLTSQRSSFGDISEPVASGTKLSDNHRNVGKKPENRGRVDKQKRKKERDHESGKHVAGDGKDTKKIRNTGKGVEPGEKSNGVGTEKIESKIEEKEDEEEVIISEDGEIGGDNEVESTDSDDDDVVTDVEAPVEKEDINGESETKGNAKKRKKLGPVFDPGARYIWKLCNTRSKHNYMPCIDFESSSGKVTSYRHHERSCPKSPPMCLVPLPQDGYEYPVPWPESKLKVFYKNVAHPKLAAYMKKHNWIVELGEFLTFPQNQSEFHSGVLHYLESIEEMVPDIEWGKNIRIMLDIGCTDTSFVSSLLEKDVLTFTLGLKDDLVDLAQVALERGFPAVVSHFGTRRLPFPSGVFDVIHCSGCTIPWHSNGGKLLLEMNRLLRPRGYFILSTKNDDIEVDEAMSSLTASICWNILAHKTDEISEVGVRIYQKPESNDIYELRRKKVPPLCDESEKPDSAWYVPMKTCLHNIPSAIEERGTEWPEEWPKRLETFPDWVNNKDKLIADTNHWKAIVNNSYLTGVGINWTSIHNVMDMKAIFGGFAAALAQVHPTTWVINVVPVQAPDTLPIIFERGLVGIYHDWCESFGTYPRSYDLLHVDHLFSRLKNRCKQPAAIVVEMDRLLRPGGWTIIRDKVDILDPLEAILRSLHWDIRLTYAENREGILCAQKTLWRP
ncbi:unnamed protein product [Rhodiola kirilowii]